MKSISLVQGPDRRGVLRGLAAAVCTYKGLDGTGHPQFLWENIVWPSWAEKRPERAFLLRSKSFPRELMLDAASGPIYVARGWTVELRPNCSLTPSCTWELVDSYYPHDWNQRDNEQCLQQAAVVAELAGVRFGELSKVFDIFTQNHCEFKKWRDANMPGGGTVSKTILNWLGKSCLGLAEIERKLARARSRAEEPRSLSPHMTEATRQHWRSKYSQLLSEMFNTDTHDLLLAFYDERCETVNEAIRLCQLLHAAAYVREAFEVDSVVARGGPDLFTPQMLGAAALPTFTQGMSSNNNCGK